VAEKPRKTEEELKRSNIDRALAGLEDAVRRCRDEDVRYGTGVSAALSFLELRADEKWPFEQFRKALEDPGMEGTKPEARWQVLNASLNARLSEWCDHVQTNSDFTVINFAGFEQEPSSQDFGL
jgi:hypothetical protein